MPAPAIAFRGGRRFTLETAVEMSALGQAVIDAVVRELGAVGVECTKDVPADDPDFRVDVKHEDRTIPIILSPWGLDEDWWGLWFETDGDWTLPAVAEPLERALRSVPGIGEIRIYASYRKLEEKLLQPWRDRWARS